MNKQAQSLLDYLLQVMPELKDQKFRLVLKPNMRDPNAKKLYGLWSDASNKITERKFRRPPTMSDSDMKSLESSGLIEIQGKELKVTSQGVMVLRKMILDDDKFHLGKESDCDDCQVKTASAESTTINEPVFFSPDCGPYGGSVYKKSNSWYQRYRDADASA